MITRRLLRPSQASPSSWICPTCTTLRASFSPPTTTTANTTFSSPSARRSLHQIPALNFTKDFSDRGVPLHRDADPKTYGISYRVPVDEQDPNAGFETLRGLFSSENFRGAWTDYQGHIVRKLNALVAGEPIENMDPKQLALTFARDPMNAAVFNHASMAWNNHFFFDALSRDPKDLSRTPQLVESLVKTFGSIDTLRDTMLDSADSMFGPGFVWLVWARNVSGPSASRTGQWRILNTYLAGTPFPEAGYRQQGVDMATNNPSSFQGYLDNQREIPANTAGAFGPHSRQGRVEAKLPPGGTTVMPVLCVNTWEHVWMFDYGVSGKRKYLESWWNALDWGIVELRAPSESKSLAQFERF